MTAMIGKIGDFLSDELKVPYSGKRKRKWTAYLKSKKIKSQGLINTMEDWAGKAKEALFAMTDSLGKFIGNSLIGAVELLVNIVSAVLGTRTKETDGFFEEIDQAFKELMTSGFIISKSKIKRVRES